MPLIIIFDRRIMAGAPAARFFNRLAQMLENADSEMV
jgi:pyruvate/2-oxoglutarate dehydrogenase complex dihydrolipoamide acyltransferase (E2) component